MKNVRFVGLVVHAETIAVAVAETGGEVRSLPTPLTGKAGSRQCFVVGSWRNRRGVRRFAPVSASLSSRCNAGT